MNIEFERIINNLPGLLEKFNKSPAKMWGDFKNLPQYGIYVFFENNKPIYVGRTKNFLRRLRQHGAKGSNHNSAPFAFNLAKNKLNKSHSFTRREMEKDPKFIKEFKNAKARVRSMSYRVIEITDPIIQTIFEVYCALELKTKKYNNFETH